MGLRGQMEAIGSLKGGRRGPLLKFGDRRGSNSQKRGLRGQNKRDFVSQNLFRSVLVCTRVARRGYLKQ